MKRIFLALSLMGMVAFLASSAAAGPNSLSDNEMDGVYAKGIEITGTGTAASGTGGAATATGTGTGSGGAGGSGGFPFYGKSSDGGRGGTGVGVGVGLTAGGKGSGGGGNGNDGIDAYQSDIGVAAAKNGSQAVGNADDVALARSKSVAVGDMDNGAVAGYRSNASDNPSQSAVAQGDSQAYYVDYTNNSAVALGRSSAVWLGSGTKDNAVQVRVSGDNAFNSQQNQTYIHEAFIYNDGGQTVANFNSASSKGGLALGAAVALGVDLDVGLPFGLIRRAPENNVNGLRRAPVRLSKDSMSKDLHSKELKRVPDGIDGRGKLQRDHQATADAHADADASAYSYAHSDNSHQNNLNKSVQVGGGGSQNHNSGNILIGVQSTVAQQVNSSSVHSSTGYGGPTLQGNAIAVNASFN
jgi:hypothetical protein